MLSVSFFGFGPCVAALTLWLAFPMVGRAQLPTPTHGWNLGNTLEPPGGEGAWGPPASQALIDGVAAAGFNTVRLPVSWDVHADQTTHEIDPAWMARVKQVVDWCVARDLTVVLNCHWDNGWLENNITDKVDPVIDAKMRAYWTQIATTFRNYDHRLLFAGANEPNCETPAQWETLKAYYETFVKAVRSSGGENASRWLVFPGPNTDIDMTDKLMNSLPHDPTPRRMVVEVHFYAPFNFCLMEDDQSWGKKFYFWGKGYHHPTRTDRNASWGEEAYVEAQFDKMKTKFVDQGIPVLLGEFQGRLRRVSPDLDGPDHRLHSASVTYFHQFVVSAANSRGIKPVYWSTPGGIFDWQKGVVTDPDSVRALTGRGALPPPSACTGTTLSVGSITVSPVAGTKERKRGRAVVSAVNSCGYPVAGVTVTGDFTGTFTQRGMSAVTDAAGLAVFTTDRDVAGAVVAKFRVTRLVKGGLTYQPSDNVETRDRN